MTIRAASASSAASVSTSCMAKGPKEGIVSEMYGGDEGPK